MIRLLVLALLAQPLVLWAQEPAPVPAPVADAAEIARLVSMLGDRSFAVREDASTKLVAIGKPAVPALEEAAKTSADLEVRQRAERAVQAIVNPTPPETAEAQEEPQGLVPAIGGFQIVQLGGAGKSIAVTRDGGNHTVSITEGGATRRYTKRADGSFTATVGGKSETYKNEDDFKAKQAKQHAEFLEHKDGPGLAIAIGVGGRRPIIVPAPFPVVPVPDAGRDARLAEMVKRLEAIKSGRGQGRFHGLVAVPAGEALRAHTGLDGGVLVESVEGGLAVELGLERLDLVLAVGDRRVTTPEELKAALDVVAEADPTVAVVLSTMRKGQASLSSVVRKK